ncbi:lipopolysaccharide biosynthesis protein [Marininema halotolerans]|uniref:Membrane protein involved in the export of O-antigen and teichoic acid n=1 Tax=Marininema halotolerans TaxID=1155944 RepID=A0A1I6P0K2_9BACL|nr:oligosaccharide flippase family protein [Marininema halotolerans]SFS33719.1 Membrane protein involved in the export of O-antigen and teichoic acid [Marininema halotolerans]
MYAKMKQLFSDSAAIGMALMGNKIVAMLLFLVFAHYLKDPQYADWDMTNTVAMIVTYLCVMGTDSAFAYYFYEAKDEQDRRGYFTAAVFMPFFISLLFLGVTWMIGSPAATLLYKNADGYQHLLLLAMLTVVANVVIQQILAYARFARQMKIFMVGTMAFVIGSNLISVGFVLQGKGVVGIFYGQAIAQTIVALLLLGYFRKHLTRHVTRTHVMNLIRYGLPLLPTLLTFWVMNGVSRPMIYHLYSPEEASIYGVAARFASMIALLTASFQLAWRPFALSIKERGDAARIYSVIARGFLVVGTLLILLLTFIIHPLILIVKEDYGPGAYLVWMIAFGVIMNTMHLIVGVGLLIDKQTKAISKTFLMAAVLFFIGNVVLVPWWGAWGTGVMTVASYLYVFFAIYRKGQRAYPVNFRFRSMGIYLIIYLTVMSVISWSQVNHLPGLWMEYLVATFLLIASVFASGLFHMDSIRFIRQRLPRLVFPR